jgi:hypothetical protein
MKRLGKFAAASGLFLLASMFISVTASAAPPGVVFQDGFESGNLSAWTKSVGLMAEKPLKHTGTWGAQGNTTTGATYAEKKLPATYADGYALVFFDLVSASSEVTLLRLRTATNTSIALVGVSKTGKLQLSPGPTKKTLTSTVKVTPGIFHSLEIHVHVMGTSGSTQVWLDGNSVTVMSTTQNLGTVPIGRMQIGDTQKGRTYDVAFDDAAFGTARI